MRGAGATAIGRTKNAAPESRLRRPARLRASSGIRQACSAMAVAASGSTPSVLRWATMELTG